MECVAYVRVSTEKQAEEGFGIDSQKRDIDLYARKNELIITDWYVDDGYTGANMNRPELQRLIADCAKKRVKCVVAFKLDRLSRSMIDGIYLIERVFQKYDVMFKCVHDSVSYDSPMEQAYTQMMAVFAQLDKNTMLLRLHGGMLERIKHGFWRGGGNLPYCYDYDKEQGILVPNAERSEKAQKAMKLYLDGYSDDSIHRMLGFECERTVTRILTSPTNIGMVIHNGIIYQGLHEPIFTMEEWEQAQAFRCSRKKAKAWSNKDFDLLTGLCYCGVCGCKMHYQQWGKRRALVCYSRDKYKSHLPNWNENCNNGMPTANEIERKVESQILEISCNLSSVKRPQKESKYEILMDNIDKERTKLKRLYNLYAEGNDDVLTMIKEQETLIANLTEKAKAERKEEDNTPKEEIVYEQIKTLADVWNRIDKQQKNKLLKIIISKIVVVNGNVDIHINNFFA